MTDQEWIDSDPAEMAIMVAIKMGELEADIEKLRAKLKTSIDEVFANSDDIDVWLRHGYWVEDWGLKKLQKLESSLAYFTHLRNLIVGEGNPDKITDFDIQRAKERPLDIVSNLEFRNAGGGKKKARCPFHDERTPSFIWWEKENTWHCFGCQAHGDVITFVMKTEGLDFVEAVRRLQ